MKKLTALLLVLSLLLCGCGSETAAPATEAATEVATEATTEPTTAPTEAPTEPAPTYVNPLNGSISDTPSTGRVFATTISNVLRIPRPTKMPRAVR